MDPFPLNGEGKTMFDLLPDLVAGFQNPFIQWLAEIVRDLLP